MNAEGGKKETVVIVRHESAVSPLFEIPDTSSSSLFPALFTLTSINNIITDCTENRRRYASVPLQRIPETQCRWQPYQAGNTRALLVNKLTATIEINDINTFATVTKPSKFTPRCYFHYCLLSKIAINISS